MGASPWRGAAAMTMCRVPRSVSPTAAGQLAGVSRTSLNSEVEWGLRQVPRQLHTGCCVAGPCRRSGHHALNGRTGCRRLRVVPSVTLVKVLPGRRLLLSCCALEARGPTLSLDPKPES